MYFKLALTVCYESQMVRQCVPLHWSINVECLIYNNRLQRYTTLLPLCYSPVLKAFRCPPLYLALLTSLFTSLYLGVSIDAFLFQAALWLSVEPETIEFLDAYLDESI